MVKFPECSLGILQPYLMKPFDIPLLAPLLGEKLNSSWAHQGMEIHGNSWKISEHLPQQSSCKTSTKLSFFRMASAFSLEVPWYTISTLPGWICRDFQKASWNGFSWFARLVSCATSSRGSVADCDAFMVSTYVRSGWFIGSALNYDQKFYPQNPQTHQQWWGWHSWRSRVQNIRTCHWYRNDTQNHVKPWNGLRWQKLRRSVFDVYMRKNISPQATGHVFHSIHSIIFPHISSMLQASMLISSWWFQLLWQILASWNDYSQYMGKHNMLQITNQIYNYQ